MPVTNVFWDKVLVVIRDFLRADLTGKYSIYISDAYKPKGNRSIRLFSKGSSILEQRSGAVDKEYEVEVSYYFINPRITDKLSEKLHKDVSNIENILNKQSNQSQPNGYINGRVISTTVNDKTSEESGVDGLNVIRMIYTVQYTVIDV